MAKNFIDNLIYYTDAIQEYGGIKAFLSSGIVLIGYIENFTGLSFTLYVVLTVVMMLDILFGMFVAIRNDVFELDKLKKWVSKFIIYGLCIGLFSAVDYSLTFGAYHILAQLVASSIVITEVISILNHCVELKLPVPPLVHKIARGAETRIKNQIDELSGEKPKRGKYE